MRTKPLVLLLWALALFLTAPVSANETRVALIIGNSTYNNVGSLPNASADATDLATAFRSIGFRVTEMANLGKTDFEAALSKFAEESAGADMAVLYYAGHGIEISKQNYLIPVDAALSTDRQVRFETVPLDTVLAALQDVRGIRIVFLDACRSNPFISQMRITGATRAIGRGLSKIEASDGTIISFSAQEGAVAVDGVGRNSPFASALLRHINEPGLELQFFLRKIRDDVRLATGGEQSPYISASLPSTPIYLVPPAEEPGATHEGSGGSEKPAQATVRTDFSSAQQVGTAAAWRAFLNKYGMNKDQDTRFYVDLAKATLNKAEPTKKSGKRAQGDVKAKPEQSRPAKSPRLSGASRKTKPAESKGQAPGRVKHTLTREEGPVDTRSPASNSEVGKSNRAALCQKLLSGPWPGRRQHHRIGRQRMYDEFCRGRKGL